MLSVFALLGLQHYISNQFYKLEMRGLRVVGSYDLIEALEFSTLENKTYFSLCCFHFDLFLVSS